MSSAGLTDEEIEQALATGNLGASQVATTSTTGALSTAFKGLSKRIADAGKSFGVFWAANPALVPILALTAAFGGIVWWANRMDKALDRQKEKLEETREEYKASIEEVDSLKTELSNINSQIDELESKDNLTFIEKDQLADLKESRENLELSLAAAEKLEQLNREKVARESKETYDAEYGAYNSDNTYENIDKILSGNAAGYVQSYNFEAVRSGDISDQLIAYVTAGEEIVRINEKINNARVEGNAKIVGELETELEYWEKAQTLSHEAIVSTLSELSRYRNDAQEGGDLEWDKQLVEQQRLIYSYYDPATYNTIKFDEIFDTEGIEVTKNELIALAQEGKLDAKVISQYENLSKAIEEAGFICDGIRKPVGMFLEQIKAGASTGEDFTATYSDSFSLNAEKMKKYQEQLEFITTAQDEYARGFETTAEKATWEAETLAKILELNPDLQLSMYMLADGTVDYDRILSELADGAMRDMLAIAPELANQITAMASASERATAKASRLSSDYYELVDVLEKVRKGETLSEKEISELISKHTDLADKVVITSNGLSIEEDALVDLATEFAGSANDIIAEQIRMTENILSGIKSRVTGYGIELEAFMSLVGAYRAASGVEKQLMANRLNGLTETNGKNGSLGDDVIAYQQAETELLSFKERLSELLNSLSTIGKNKTSSKEINWIDESITTLTNDISKLDAQIATVEGFDKKIEYYDVLIGKNKDLAEAYKIAANASMSEYQGLKASLTADQIRAIESGDYFAIEEFKDEANYDKVKKAVEVYRDYQKYSADYLNQLETWEQSYLDKAGALQEKYDDRLNNIEARKSALQTEIDQIEARGGIVSAEYYNELITLENESIDRILAEKDAMQSIFDAGVASGAIKKYSSEWFSFMEIIQNLNEEAQQGESALIDYTNSIRDIEWATFDRILEDVKKINDEADFLIDLMSNSKLIDDKGNYTQEGIATLAMHRTNYQTNNELAQAYKAEADSLVGATDEASINRREKLLGLYRGCISAAQSEKQAMIELAQEGIQTQIDLMGEYIDKKKEALEAERELSEYAESVAEKQKDIATIQKQINALAGDDSESAKKQLRELKSKLSDAEKDLADTEKDHSYDEQEKALDDFLEVYTGNMEDIMNNTNQLFTDTMVLVDSSANIVGNTLNKVATEAGYDISTNITDAWNNSSTAATGFSNTLTTISSNITGVIDGIKGKWDELATSAKTAALEQLKALNSGSLTSGLGEIPLTDSVTKSSIESWLKNPGDGLTNSAKSEGDDGWSKLSMLNKTLLMNGFSNLNYAGIAALANMLMIEGHSFHTAEEVKARGDNSDNPIKKLIVNALHSLQIPGFSTGGLVEDGIAGLRVGEAVLDERTVKIIKDFNTTAPFIDKYWQNPQYLNGKSGNNVTVSDGAVQIAVNGVRDINEFFRELENPRSIKKIRTMIFSPDDVDVYRV